MLMASTARPTRKMQQTLCLVSVLRDSSVRSGLAHPALFSRAIFCLISGGIVSMRISRVRPISAPVNAHSPASLLMQFPCALEELIRVHWYEIGKHCTIVEIWNAIQAVINKARVDQKTALVFDFSGHVRR